LNKYCKRKNKLEKLYFITHLPLFESTNLNSFHKERKTDNSPYYPQTHGEKAPSPEKLKILSVKPKKSDTLHHFTFLEKERLNEAF
jgi:hypothetical protein